MAGMASSLTCVVDEELEARGVNGVVDISWMGRTGRGVDESENGVGGPGRIPEETALVFHIDPRAVKSKRCDLERYASDTIHIHVDLRADSERSL